MTRHENQENNQKNNNRGLEIAIIGMACRFPGAKNILEYQANLEAGVESVVFFSEQELREAGIKEEWLKDPSYVKSSGCPLEDADCFDNSFFGYTAREAALMDPQLRLFHEVVWEALENAGYTPENFPGLIGLYGGAGFGFNWEALAVLSGKSEDIDAISLDQLINKDYICARVSYKLNLKGPVVSLQTTCSTSLVAVHFACRALLTGECDLAIAGGARVLVQPRQGYFYREGMVSSRDGHCCAFDAAASGTASGSGAGAVVLKRRKQAEEDGDHTWAVILGSAINSDGSRKIGFSAPSPEAQADAIHTALKITRVEPESIGYIETHGTGTVLGDPVEVAALKKAFAIENKGICALGSVKTAVGHLDAAAGVAGLIKTALALKHRVIPPSLHFQIPNPAIDFIASPFYINTLAATWENNRNTENNIIYPRRAGVSSFGMGGTNAHIILEEAPPVPHTSTIIDDAASKHPAWKLLLLSARMPAVLEQMGQNLKVYLENNPGISLADVAYTLQTGRKAFPYRRMLVAAGISEAVTILASPDSTRGKLKSALAKKDKKPVAFIFPGLGSQYVNMGVHLYRCEPLFREEVDRCFLFVKTLLNKDFQEILYPGELRVDNEKAARFQEGQLLVFIFEYALARLLMNWGIYPQAMIGYSLGEYTAACLSGVLSLEDALKLLVVRGELVNRTAAGGMLSIPCPREQLEPLPTKITGSNLLSIAIDNGTSCVAAGPAEQIEILQEEMKTRHLVCMRLETDRALHSPLMKPVLNSFGTVIEKVALHNPSIPYISNLTGDWISNDEARSSHYWVRHMGEPVRFADGLGHLLAQEDLVIIEVGPGNMLANLVKSHPCLKPGHTVIPLIPNLQARANVDEEYFFQVQLGRLWLCGVDIQWQSVYGCRKEKRNRLALPAYPFERQRFPISFNFRPDLQKMKNFWPTANWDEVIAANSNKKAAGMLSDKELLSPGGAVETTEWHGNENFFQQRPDLSTPYIPPGDEIEQTLALIFQDFFGLEKVGIEDDFFQLGGDSLKAMNVVSKIYKVLGVEIPLKEFFQGRTIKAISAYIRQDGIKSSQYIEIQPAEEKEYYPLSSVQKRLYLQQQMAPASTAYNITCIQFLQGKVDVKRLEQAFQQLIARHQVLRTYFAITGQDVVQRIHKQMEWQMEYSEELALFDDRQIKEKILQFVKPFDLSKLPLIRIKLVKMAENKNLLMLGMHHLLMDLVSMSVLINEVRAFYAGRPLQPLKLQYKDFCHWQQEMLNSGKLELQKQYWLNLFSGELPVLKMPTDYPKIANPNFEGDDIFFVFDQELTARLNSLISQSGTTLFMLLMTLYNILLSKFTGQEDIIVGITTAHRTHADLETMIGLLIETLALRNKPLADKSFAEFLAEVRLNTLDAFDNQSYPFRELMLDLASENDFHRDSLFDTMLLVQNVDYEQGDEHDEDGLKFIPYKELPMGTTKLDIIIEAIEIENYIDFRLQYSTKIFKKSSMQKLIDAFKHIAQLVVKDQTLKLKDIRLPNELNTAISDIYDGMEGESFSF